MKRILCALLLFLSFAASARTLSAALGFQPADKVLIIHADDMGSASSANDAISDLFAVGAVKAGSLMLPCPAFPQALAYARLHSSADLGVHLTLTSEWRNYRWGPLLPINSVPSLVADDGDFHSGLFPLFFFGREPDFDAEMEAQIQAALRSGWQPTHVDTHMGSVFLHPSWLYSYLNLARKYHLPPMIPRWSAELEQTFFGGLGTTLMNLLDGSGLFSAPAIFNKIETAGFLPLDYLYMFPSPVTKSNDYDGRKQFYLQLLRSLQPGVSQIIIHPAYNRGDFANILDSNPDQVWRSYEAQIFQDPEVIQTIHDLGIHLIGWKDVGAVYDWSSVTELN